MHVNIHGTELPDDFFSNLSASESKASSKLADARRRPEIHKPGEEFSYRIKWLSEVEAKPVEWRWKPYIPIGMPTMLTGDPGAGKSFIALSISAEATRRGEVIIYLTVENPTAQVLRPRFDALGGDPSKLALLEGLKFGDSDAAVERTVTLQDVPVLERFICETKAKFVVVDPIQSYLGANIDAHRSNETRPILDGLAELADKYHLAMLLLRHCAKNGSGRAIYKGLGSIDFTGAVRSELFAGQTLDGRRAMVHIKSNIGPIGRPQGYEIFEADGFMAGSFKWTGDTQIGMAELTEPELPREEQSAGRKAEAFLLESLANGPRLAKELLSESREAGISEITLRRAKDKLDLTARKRDDLRWEWLLPESKAAGGDRRCSYTQHDHLQTPQHAKSITTTTLAEGDQGDHDDHITGDDHLHDHAASDPRTKPYKPGISEFTGKSYPPRFSQYEPKGD